jgi:hypothetical protein
VHRKPSVRDVNQNAAAMKRTVLAACSISLVLAAGAARAETKLINFDDLAPGVTLTDQYAASGATFTANAFSGPGTSSSTFDWADNTDMTIVSLSVPTADGSSYIDLAGYPQLASGNILRSFDAYFSSENGDASFRVDFSTPINSFSALFVGVKAGDSTASQDVTLWAYNGTDLVGNVSGSETVSQFALSVAAPTITSVVVRPGSFNGWVGVDNISFNTIDSVPEISTVAMMALGLAVIALKRRKTH